MIQELSQSAHDARRWQTKPPDSQALRDRYNSVILHVLAALAMRAYTYLPFVPADSARYMPSACFFLTNAQTDWGRLLRCREIQAHLRLACQGPSACSPFSGCLCSVLMPCIDGRNRQLPKRRQWRGLLRSKRELESLLSKTRTTVDANQFVPVSSSRARDVPELTAENG